MDNVEILHLKEKIELLFAFPTDGHVDEAIGVFNRFKDALNSGEIRAAEKVNGQWEVNLWVKKGILLGFRIGQLVEYSVGENLRFFDKETYPLKQMALADQVRQVPACSSIRDGAHIAKGVVIMPPAYINVGAYVGERTMIDSNTVVGSCAQIGENVHVSAGSQIGGVLEPVGALPVILEDDVMVGGNCGIYEGAIVKQTAVIGAGTILTGSTPVMDTVKGQIYQKTGDSPLIIPEGAVVVPGCRPASGEFARKNSLFIYTPLIIKYRDGKTNAATLIEEDLR